MDRECRLVHRSIALDHLPLFIDQDQIGYTNMREVHPKRIDPEMVRQLRIARRDMTSHPLAEAELGKQPKCRCQALLAMQALLGMRRKPGRLRSLGDLHPS